MPCLTIGSGFHQMTYRWERYGGASWAPVEICLQPADSIQCWLVCVAIVLVQLSIQTHWSAATSPVLSIERKKC